MAQPNARGEMDRDRLSLQFFFLPILLYYPPCNTYRGLNNSTCACVLDATWGPDECQEFLPCLLSCSECTQHCRGYCCRTRFLDTTHCHAQVTGQGQLSQHLVSEEVNLRGFHHYSHSLGFDRFLDGDGNLASKPLLDLEPPAKGLGYPRKFRQP